VKYAPAVLRLERVPLEGVDPTIEAHRTRNVFQTREWLEFVARTQQAEPVVAHVERDGEVVGAFTGLIVRRMGVRILGSPFQGWMTGPMGFSLNPGVPRAEAMKALVRFAFRKLGCLHVELMDRHAGFEELGRLRARLVEFPTYELDLTQDEDALFAGMTSACRRAVRKGRRVGVRVEEAHGVEFADEYYDQLLDVFERQGQGRKPPYDLERVREMIRCIEPSGNLLMLRAVAPEGERIATAIFPAREDFAYFWGGASWRSHQILRPNEAIFWHAIRHFRERGVPMLDLGGGGDYKRKFGAPEKLIPYVRKSRVPGMLALRDLAAYVYKRRATRAPRPAPRPAPAPAPGRAATPFPRATTRGLQPRPAEPAEAADAQRDRVERP
jgi:CelD/BcsL family acetyltransferase involved in cellulose biosynthesis